jgi:hypothetical protein
MTGDRAGGTTRRNTPLPGAKSVAGTDHSFKDVMPDISPRGWLPDADRPQAGDSSRPRAAVPLGSEAEGSRVMSRRRST